MVPDSEVRLTQMTKTAGCAAKIGPGTLAGILENLPKFEDPNLLVGIETSDDGAIYRVNDELALIQTLDFFTPVVDDPYIFGQVAAANALSDIYAMGGEPKVALNIVAWPNCVNPAFLGKILEGGACKVLEAGAVLAGGHSIQDDEPKYGLSVTGFVHPDKVFKNCGARPGDVLILTKPLGTGIVNTAVKADMASEEAKKEVIRVMTSLNKKAKQVVEHYGVHSCTDVTGFGLAGHSVEMAEGSGVTLEIFVKDLPIQKEAPELAQMGLIPEGAYRNRSFAEDKVDFGETEEYLCDIFCDPQTSGGLLVSVSPWDAEQIMKDFETVKMETACRIIGRVVEKEEKYVKLR
ncbi:selenide, water dikinase SelD [Clostridium sp. Marseille-P2415]|uniref:selenide, water dikinase SelD n=1 Tax=Clostridium sp. Marseille-P2415 TaxID=1805471 RepID=UPI0009888E6E|nr:selenide, water dikinase SelD [Clostridium sp. Marseille-P2415]